MLANGKISKVMIYKKNIYLEIELWPLAKEVNIETNWSWEEFLGRKLKKK